MKKQRILVDVDTQKDFMESTGALYVPTEKTVVTNIERLTQLALPRIGSVDSHAYDAWEFEANGGPFPPHCVKGTEGWLKVSSATPEKLRFVPMGTALVIGDEVDGGGAREYTPVFCAKEIQEGVSIYFEKEVYSLFVNPFAEQAIAAYAEWLRGQDIESVFAVYGYCTGGFCVDAAALGLVKRGYQVELILDATAPLDAKGGIEKITLPDMRKAGVRIVTTEVVCDGVN